MAVTIDWPTKVINVPRADMLLVQSVPTEIRELDIDSFRLSLKALEAGGEGMPFLDTHNNNPPVTVGGVTLARVIEIINGYSVTFEDGQYAVNLVGANSNIGDVTNVNQVSVRSANSAGLTYSKEIEDQSYTDSRVWIDTVNGTTGTQYPQGTPGDPVDNKVDAYAIIANRGLPKRWHLAGSLSIINSDDLDGLDIRGGSSVGTMINLTNANTQNFSASVCTITGTASGDVEFNNRVILEDYNGFSGSAEECELKGTLTLAGASAEHSLFDCWSGVPGTGTPIVDCNSLVGLELAVRPYTGGIQINNCSGAGSEISIDLLSGRVILDSTCTAGTIIVRGTGWITDNSGPGCTVIIEGLTYGTSGLTATESAQLGEIDTLRKLMMNGMETNPTTGILTIYDDDDVSVFLQGNIYEDVLAAQLYRGQGIERRNRLT